MDALARAALAILAFAGICLAEEADSWTRHEISGGIVLQILVDPSNHDVVYAQGPGISPYYSDDGGAHWRRGSPAPGATDFWSNSGRMAASAVAVWRGVKERLYVSRDGARTWEEVARFDGKWVRTVAVDPPRPDDPCVLLSASDTKGTDWWFASAKGGFVPVPIAHWARPARPMRVMPPFNCEIAFLGGDPPRLACCLVGPGQDQGEVATSEDGGKTWRRTILDEPIFDMAAIPGRDGVLVGIVPQGTKESTASAYISEDCGKTWGKWEPASAGTAVRSIAFSPDGRIAWLGTREHGLQAHPMAEGGSPPAPNGIADSRICTIAVADASVVYAGTGDGAYRSADGGATWTRTCEGLSAMNLQGMIFGEGGWMAVLDFTSGVHESEDGGKTWKASHPAPGQNCRALWGDHGLRLLVCDSGLWVRRHGEEWAQPTEGPGKAFDISFVDDGEMYAIEEGGRVYRSADGLIWKPFGPGRAPQKTVTSVAARHGEVAVVGEGEVAMWKEGDRDWRTVQAAGREEVGWFDGWTGDSLVLALDHSVVSIEGGRSRTLFALPADDNRLTASWSDPADPKHALAVTTTHRVLRTTDGGGHWEDFASGLPDVRLMFLAVGPDGQVYLGSDGALVSRPLQR